MVRNRISPNPPKDNKQTTLTGVGNWSWADQSEDGEETARKRRRRSFEAGTEEYAAYIQKRVFNKREAWTPFLWERIRDKRRLGNLNPIRGWKGWKYRQKMRWNTLKFTWREWNSTLELWRGDLKQIEGLQGTGVVSYFVFLKWLLFLNIFIFLVLFFVVVLFQVAFESTEFDKAVTGVDDSSTFPGVILSENCSVMYRPNVTGDALQLILDFVQGTGWMETTAFFYGYYSNARLSIPTGKYNMPLAYMSAICIIYLVSLVLMVHHALSKFLDTLLITEERRRSAKFFYAAYSRWDYRVNELKSIPLQQKSFYDLFRSEIEEQRHERKKAESSNAARFLLLCIRILINIVVIGILVGAGASIFFAQKFSLEFTSSVDAASYHPIVLALVQFLPSAIIAAFNGLSPVIFQLLIKFEDYTPFITIQITTFRVVFLRLSSLAVLVTKVYIDVTCSPTDNCRIGTGVCKQIQCWESYVGQQVYKLVVVEFACDVLVTLCYELPRKLLTTKIDHDLLKKIGPAEFDIPSNVLDLVYAQTLCWLGIFFAPLISAMGVIRFIILFYLRKLSALYNTVPPERPYQAARSNVYFMFTLMIAFVGVSIPIGYVLVKMTPSPMCGPYRIYDTPVDILYIKIKTADYWFQTIWSIVTSSAFVALIIILMALAIYYLSALKGRQSQLISLLKLQILQDEKDKQHLISKLGEYTTEFGSDKTEPASQSRIKTVNEVNKIHHVPEKPGPPSGLVVEMLLADLLNQIFYGKSLPLEFGPVVVDLALTMVQSKNK